MKNLTYSSTDFSVLPIQCQRTKIGRRPCSSPERIGRAQSPRRDRAGHREGTLSVPQIRQLVLTTAGPPMTSTPRWACNSTVMSGIKTRLADGADHAWRLSNRSTRVRCDPASSRLARSTRVGAPCACNRGSGRRRLGCNREVGRASASRRCQVGTSSWIPSPSRRSVRAAARRPRTERGRDAAGHLDLPQTRSCSGVLSLSQHPGQARRRTGPAGRPSRALWVRQSELQISSSSADDSLSGTPEPSLPPLSGQTCHW